MLEKADSAVQCFHYAPTAALQSKSESSLEPHTLRMQLLCNTRVPLTGKLGDLASLITSSTQQKTEHAMQKVSTPPC